MSQPVHATRSPAPARTGPRSGPPVHELKAELFRALAHPVRVRLLETLVDGEQPVSHLIGVTGLEASHLSQHLAVLRRTGVATARREGNAVHYRLADPSVADMLAAGRTFLLARLEGTREALDDLAGDGATTSSPRS